MPKKIYLSDDKDKGPWAQIPAEVLVLHREMREWITPKDYEAGSNMTLDAMLITLACTERIGGDWSKLGEIKPKEWGNLEEVDDLKSLAEIRIKLVRRVPQMAFLKWSNAIFTEVFLSGDEEGNSDGSPQSSAGDPKEDTAVLNVQPAA